MIYNHLENYLGPIIRGWSTNENDLGIQVSLFNEIDKPGVNTYSSLGLNKIVLDISNKSVRHELIFAAYETYPTDEISYFLMTFAEYIAKRGVGLLRGDFMTGFPLIKGATVSGIYASIPVFWPDEFHIYEDTSPKTVLVWLIPITNKEADTIADKGWDFFEDLLEGSDCDFWDLKRKSLL